MDDIAKQMVDLDLFDVVHFWLLDTFRSILCIYDALNTFRDILRIHDAFFSEIWIVGPFDLFLIASVRMI